MVFVTIYGRTINFTSCYGVGLVVVVVVPYLSL
jgi:hypothetical protein